MVQRKTQDSGETNGAARYTMPLRALLMIAFGGLVAVAVGLVLALTVRANFINTFSLLNLRAVELIDGMERQLRAEAAEAERSLSAVARLFDEGAIGIEDSPARRAVLEALLRTAPAVEGILIVGADSVAEGMFRDAEGNVSGPPDRFPAREIAARFPSPSTLPLWAAPVSVDNRTYQVVGVRLTRLGSPGGLAVAVIGQNTVNRIVGALGRQNDATVFLLDGSGAVVSHSRLPEQFRDRASVPLSEFPDPVLRGLVQAREDSEFDRAGRSGIRVFNSADGRDGHIYLTKELPGYSATPYTLGVYFLKTDIGQEIFRTLNSLIAGLAGLVAAVLLAMMIGKRISKPMAQIAAAASRFTSFRLDEIEVLPRSRIREIDDQAVALNRMRTAMQQFTRYVPRELVARLVRSGDEANRPVEREVTVMFTDICGFTAYSERLGPAEVARVLNGHFEMLSHAVEETGGTIDKFMGDGAMAFWGAPEADAEHALHAVRAAEAMAARVQEDNRLRRERGEQPLRLRIGIHSGRVVVGNIGSELRQNYTIVGDPVNVAQRLEQLGKEIMRPQDDVIVLASSAVVTAVRDQALFTPAGTRIIRGRERPIAVSLLASAESPADNVVPFTGSA